MDQTRSNQTLKIDIEWEKKEDFETSRESCLILTNHEADPMNFEAHKFLDESLGDSLLLKESGNLLTAHLLLKISIPKKTELIS